MTARDVSQQGQGPGRRFALAEFTGGGYDKGRPIPVQVLWMVLSRSIAMRWWCPNSLRVFIFKCFGAHIGEGVLIRHDVKVHWPWKLTIGAHSWVGEGAWILNLEPVIIGANTCISQGVLLCTGSHRQDSPTFEFDNAAIRIGDSVWVAARATILRGVEVGSDVTIGATALVTRDVPAGAVVLASASEVRTVR